MVTQVQSEITGQVGLPGLTSMYFVGDADATSAQTLSDRVGDFWAACASRIQNSTDIRTTGIVTVIDDASGLITASHAVTPTLTPGGGIQARLPAGTQGLLHTRTGQYRGGRAVRGRIYIPSPTEVDNDAAGVPGEAYKDQVVAAANSHLVGSLDFPLCVWSPTYLSVVQVTGVGASPNWARLSTRRT